MPPKQHTVSPKKQAPGAPKPKPVTTNTKPVKPGKPDKPSKPSKSSRPSSGSKPTTSRGIRSSGSDSGSGSDGGGSGSDRGRSRSRSRGRSRGRGVSRDRGSRRSVRRHSRDEHDQGLCCSWLVILVLALLALWAILWACGVVGGGAHGHHHKITIHTSALDPNGGYLRPAAEHRAIFEGEKPTILLKTPSPSGHPGAYLLSMPHCPDHYATFSPLDESLVFKPYCGDLFQEIAIIDSTAHVKREVSFQFVGTLHCLSAPERDIEPDLALFGLIEVSPVPRSTWATIRPCQSDNAHKALESFVLDHP